MSIRTFLKDEKGQSMVEYGITMGGIAAVSYLAVVVLGDRIADLYAWMANHLPGGEDDEGGQVRVEGVDGLVGINEPDADTDFNGAITFGDRNATNFLMVNTLGGNSAADVSTGEWD